MKRILGLAICVAMLVGMAAIPASSAEPLKLLVVMNQEAVTADDLALIGGTGATVTSVIPDIGVVAVEATDAAALARLPGVFAVDADPIVDLPATEVVAYEEDPATIDTSADDLYNRSQWDIKRVGGTPANWAVESGNPGVVVAILDTGIYADHPDLAGKVIRNVSFVPGQTADGHGHGTHCAGAVAAMIGGGRCIGVAPNVSLAGYKVLGDNGSGMTSWIVSGITTAANDGVDVISMSLGGFRIMQDATSRAGKLAYQRAVRYAIKKGVTVVAAAGNNGFDLDAHHYTGDPNDGTYVEVPGTLPGVLCISASTSRDTLAGYSNYGNYAISFTAPGGDTYARPSTMCLSTYSPLGSLKGAYYVWMTGTSMATPKIAGLAALVISHEGKLQPSQVAEKLKAAADDLGKVGHDEFFGWGLPTIDGITR